MRKISDLTAGCPSPGSSVVAPLSYNGMDGGGEAVLLLQWGLFCKATSVTPFIPSDTDVDVLSLISAIFWFPSRAYA